MPLAGGRTIVFLRILIEDSMKKNLITFLLATASLLGASAVWAKNVKTADKDNDGTLDKTEATAMPMVAKNFEAIDTDKDGTVDQIEIDTFRVMMGDKDSDGTLDKKEIKNKAIAKAFDQLDTDKDGTLDAKEISAFFAQK
jgi:hypothetical protein